MAMTLVTGASGFVGSHLIEEMERRGLPVRGVTRGTAPGLTTIPSYGPEVDWSEYLEGVDTVIHLAARVHVMQETSLDPLSLFRKANVAATINLARQAAATGVRRFVFVSSIKVNGERTEPDRPFTANDPPSPRDPYGISKAEAEAALMAVARETGIEITIVRPPLVYGPGVRGNLRTLMKWAATGMPSIFAGIKNKRSFVHVENLCDLLIMVRNHPMAANQVFLISDGQDMSTHELYLRLANLARRKPLSIPVPVPVLQLFGQLMGRSDAIHRLTESLQIDQSDSLNALGWRPRSPPSNWLQ
jgi:nucleoside-diphosphate-sugar epimerase